MRYWLLLFCFICALQTGAQQRFDVLIDEIMADPSPQVGLPNAEYIELKNVSGKDINLQGWRLSTTSSQSGAFPNYVLPADSFLIITSTSNVSSFSSSGRTLGIPGFPALANDGTMLLLSSKDNKIIHFVNYTTTWYQNEVKEEGGWSLEMIDTHNPCAGLNNWKASTDNTGGTPGKRNSVDGTNKDLAAPQLKNAYLKDNSTIILQFDEPVDSALAVVKSNYSLAPSQSIDSVSVAASGFSEVELKLNAGLTTSTVYELSITGAKDCAGNEISAIKTILAIPREAVTSDIAINEILFNPKSDGYDYVEFYNRSNKTVDASKLYIANRNSAGSLINLKKISEQPRYIFPGDYIVITEDASSLNKSYFVKNGNKVFELSALPSLPDDKGNIVLTNIQGTVVDELSYSDDWHFDLLVNEEGVSLERIDPEGPTQDQNNWHSAASTAGFGTPTYRNSQYKQTESISALIYISPKIFSPDNDSFEDLASVQYQLTEPGYVANVVVLDVTGKEVRHLVKNATLGLKGSWNWDGLDEKGKKLPVGNYIIYTEIFNLQGKRKSFKNVVVLARRIN